MIGWLVFPVRFIPQRYVPIWSGIQIPNFWGTLWFLYFSFFLRNHCKQNVRYCFYILQVWSYYLQKLNFVYLWRPIYSLCKYLQKDFRINSDSTFCWWNFHIGHIRNTGFQKLFILETLSNDRLPKLFVSFYQVVKNNFNFGNG